MGSAPTGSDPATSWVAAPDSLTGSSTSFTITGLTNGVTYRVRVRAQSAGGNGAYAFDTGTPTTPVVSFDQATLSKAEGSGQITSFPISVTPIPATASRIWVRVDPASTATRNTEYAVPVSTPVPADEEIELSFSVLDDTDNEPHETVILRLEAQNNVPYVLGTQKTITITITDNDPPAAPTGLTLTGDGETSMTARWNRPDGPVTQYQLRYKESSATDQTATTPGDPSTGWVTSTPTVTSAQITGLSSGTVYHVQVRANDGQTQAGNGNGPWSATVTATPAHPNSPGAPKDLTAVPTGTGELKLNWRHPVPYAGRRLAGSGDHEPRHSLHLGGQERGGQQCGGGHGPDRGLGGGEQE